MPQKPWTAMASRGSSTCTTCPPMLLEALSSQSLEWSTAASEVHVTLSSACIHGLEGESCCCLEQGIATTAVSQPIGSL